MSTENLNCKDCADRSCAVAILSNPELEVLNSNISNIRFEKGERLFKQAALNSHILYIRRGLVKVHMRSEDQKDFILKITPAPAYLGLPTIFGDCVNQYSATAIEPTDACCIDITTFKSLIRNNGAFAYEIIADICKDELCNFRNFVDKAHKQAPGRLAGALIYFAEQVYHQSEFRLPLTRSELAELISTSRESVSRNLHLLKEAGIIDLDKNRIRILKREKLRLIHMAG